MAFNSWLFFFFTAAVYTIFRAVSSRQRIWVLLGASYSFYACFSWQAVPVLLGVSILSYACALMAATSDGMEKRIWFWSGLLGFVGILIYFKYVDFIIESLNAWKVGSFDVLHILLPVGISFYVFQAVSYLIDVYLNKITPETKLPVYLLYLSFFPKLLQGPIERGGTLLPQLREGYIFRYDQFSDACKLILIGLVKKTVIADRLAILVNTVFPNVSQYAGIELWVAMYAFAFQLYFDFSGYTDIARGVAKIFGIDLSENFARPYLATNIQDFWRRWHITFSSWLRDYLFTPLLAAFRNWGVVGIVLVTLITFFICGLWHGASWGFVVFGLLHGIYMTASILTLKKRRQLLKPWLSTWWLQSFEILITFHLVAFSFIFFRSDNLPAAEYFIKHMWSSSVVTLGGIYSTMEIASVAVAWLLLLLPRKPGVSLSRAKSVFLNYSQYAVYGAAVNLTLFFSTKSHAPFLYFRF